MRTRLRSLLATVVALTLASLLVVPLTVAAQSAAISMYPESAGPGSTVEIAGIGFPSERVVEVEVATPNGTVPLATATTNREGAFRQIVALPLDMAEGAWEVQASASDGTTAAYGFVTSPDAAVGAALSVSEEAPAPAGNTSGDIALMLVVAVVLGGLAFGAMVVYRQVRDESPPGMGRGDDLIWGGGTAEAPQQTATDEPHWKTAQASQTAEPSET